MRHRHALEHAGQLREAMNLSVAEGSSPWVAAFWGAFGGSLEGILAGFIGGEMELIVIISLIAVPYFALIGAVCGWFMHRRGAGSWNTAALTAGIGGPFWSFTGQWAG